MINRFGDKLARICRPHRKLAVALETILSIAIATFTIFNAIDSAQWWAIALILCLLCLILIVLGYKMGSTSGAMLYLSGVTFCASLLKEHPDASVVILLIVSICSIFLTGAESNDTNDTKRAKSI